MAIQSRAVKIKNLTNSTLNIEMHRGPYPYALQVPANGSIIIPFGLFYENANIILQLKNRRLVTLYAVTERNEEIPFDSPIDLEMPHNELSNIQGGKPGEYFHLTKAQHEQLTTGTETTLHTHNHETLTNLQGDGPNHYHLTENQFQKLAKQQNADDLHKHKHNNLEDLSGDGDEFYHLNENQFTGLTRGNETDLHTHKHNSLTNKEGVGPQYIHLNQNQYDTLTQGNNADDLHTHTKTGITDFKEDDYVHRFGNEAINGEKTFNDPIYIDDHKIQPWDIDPSILEFSRNGNHDSLVFWSHIGGGSYTYWNTTASYGLYSYDGNSQKKTAHTQNGIFRIIKGMLEGTFDVNLQYVKKFNIVSFNDNKNNTILDIKFYDGEFYYYDPQVGKFVSINSEYITFNYPYSSTNSVWYRVGYTYTASRRGYPLTEGNYLIKNVKFIQHPSYTITGTFRIYKYGSIIYQKDVSNINRFEDSPYVEFSVTDIQNIALYFYRTDGTTNRAVLTLEVKKVI